ncbi:MAG TPA: methyl-accepting chemotaxis protein [Desulfuromonadales bacterium]|nr:methyl-accepting chemotaxis protein [Desulfuromonadales bacterium]
MDWFKNLRVRNKILFSFSLVILMVLAMGALIYQTSALVADHATHIEKVEIPHAHYANEMRVEIIDIQRAIAEISATQAKDGLDKGLAEAQKSYKSFLTNLSHFQDRYQQENNQEGLQRVEELKPLVASYYQDGKTMAQDYINGGSALGNKEMLSFKTEQKTLMAKLGPFVHEQEAGMTQKLDEVLQGITHLKLEVALISLVILLLVGLVGWMLTASTVKPLMRTMEMIQALEAGNLDQRLKLQRRDEIGQMAKSMDAFADNLRDEILTAFHRLAEGDFTFEAHGLIREPLAKANQRLNEVMAQLQTGGIQIAAGAAQVSDSSQSLSQGATEQASSLEEISASMHQLSTQTKHNAENATQANQLMSQARSGAEEGNTQMQKMVVAMGEINTSSQNISKIIKVIDEIAFQTNLLALNAAVEAARAGQHGKGFAVVAEEVRNLAARSAKAAKETADLIEGSVQKTQNGAQIAEHTAKALQQIVADVTKVTDLVAEIAAASNEQAQGIAQINQGIAQIDQVTQQNTANAEESAAAAEELSSQASHQKQMLERFKLAQGRHGMTGSHSARDNRKSTAPSPMLAWKGGGMPANDRGETSTPVIAIDDAEFGRY